MRRFVDGLALRVPPAVVALDLLLAMKFSARWGPGLPGPSAALDRLGTAITILGAGIMMAGLWQFRRHRTTVDPMHPELAETLVDSGVFAWSRHPMYVGFVAVLLGAALMFDAAWSLLGPLALAAWLHRFQIRPEERVLSQRFGAAFDAYCRRVPRWLGRRRG